jgi:nucleoid-associated protein YgaU
MNRQVVPSIALSVLIVCFFAVALFQHDPPGATPRQKPPIGREANNGAGTKAATTPTEVASASTESTSTAIAATSARISNVKHSGIPQASGQRAEQPPDRAVSISSVTLGRTASVRPFSYAPSVPSSSSAGAATNDKNYVARRPRSAFTVVDRDETISDVALRVYGTTVEVESLWQANRDSLPRKDSPVSSGMLLRTPRIR